MKTSDKISRPTDHETLMALPARMTRNALAWAGAIQDGGFSAVDVQLKSLGAMGDLYLKSSASLLDLAQSNARSCRKALEDALEDVAPSSN
jgi:hypothetical protein